MSLFYKVCLKPEGFHVKPSPQAHNETVKNEKRSPFTGRAACGTQKQLVRESGISLYCKRGCKIHKVHYSVNLVKNRRKRISKNLSFSWNERVKKQNDMSSFTRIVFYHRLLVEDSNLEPSG